MNEFADYLQQRWDEGCHNASRLYQEIRQKGYSGKRAMVARMVSGWRKAGKAARPKAAERIAPRHAAILVTRADDQMSEEQRQLFDRIAMQCPDVLTLRAIALGFGEALKSGALHSIAAMDCQGQTVRVWTSCSVRLRITEGHLCL